MRLAGVDDRAAELFITASQRSGAINEGVAAVDHDVRVGANHRHAAVRYGPQFRFIIVGRFGLVVSEAGAQHILGVLERNESRLSASSLCGSVEEAEVAPRSDVEDPVAFLFLHQSDGHVARRDDRVERFRRNPKPQNLPVDGRRRPWSIGDQNHRPAAPPERPQRFRRGRKRGHAVVEDAPDIAKNRIIASGDLAKTSDLPSELHLFLPHHRAFG